MSRHFGWNIMVICDIQNYDLVEGLDGHDVLGRLKPEEREFVKDMTKSNKVLRFIVVALKDMNVDNMTTV